VQEKRRRVAGGAGLAAELDELEEKRRYLKGSTSQPLVVTL